MSAKAKAKSKNMKTSILSALITALLVGPAAYYFWSVDRWTVEPIKVGDTGTMADWKWRACFSEDLGQKGCGSPLSYDEAQWWVVTRGGTQVYDIAITSVIDNVIHADSFRGINLYVGDESAAGVVRWNIIDPAEFPAIGGAK